MVQPARRLVARRGASRESAFRRIATASLRADRESERGRDHQQGRHDRYEQSHGCFSFVGDICSPSTQDTPDEVRSDRPRHRR